MRRCLSIIIGLVVCALFASCILLSWWTTLAVGLLLLGAVGYVEKIFSVEVSKNLRIVFLTIFISFSVGNLFYSHYKENSINRKLQIGEKASEASKDQIADLTTKESDLRQKLHQTQDDLGSAKGQIADLTEKNRHLQHESKEARDAATAAKAETDALTEYGEVATYTFRGLQQSGQFLSPFTPVSKWTEGYLTVSNNKYLFKCIPDAIEHYKDLIIRCPKFPFPYLALSACLLKNGDPSWRHYAIEAQTIMRKTTKIPLHSKDHDGWLGRVNQFLDPAQMNSVVVEEEIHKSE